MATKLTRDHHLLSRNLKLNGNYISNDGDDEGISIDNSGGVVMSSSLGIGNEVPGSTLEASTTAASSEATRPCIEISSFSDANDLYTSAGVLKFHKSANDTINSYGADSHTAVGEVIGRIEAWGVDNDGDNSSDEPVLSSYIEFSGDAVAADRSVPGKIVFATSDGDDVGEPTVRMTLDDGGNVGIGVTDPDSLLEVFGTASQLKISYDASNYAAMTVASDGELKLATTGTDAIINLDSADDIIIDSATGIFNFYLAGDTVDYFKIIRAANGVTTLSTADTIGSIAHLKLDADGNIILDSVFGVTRFYDGGDTTDYAILTVVGGTGATTLATVSAGNDGHMTIAPNGNLILSSDQGGFEMHGAGTTAKFADMYAGMILGYTRIQNDSSTSGDNAINVTSTMTVLETVTGTECKVTFVAPPSESVEIQFSCQQIAGRFAYYSLSSAASYAEVDQTHTYDSTGVIHDETDAGLTNIAFSITSGLTAGTSYTRWIAAKSNASSFNIQHGRNALTGLHDPPIIIRAIALPATIVTGE